jgi:hypothetical protein
LHTAALQTVLSQTNFESVFPEHIASELQAVLLAIHVLAIKFAVVTSSRL